MVHVVIHSYKDSVQTQDLIYLDFQGSFESVDNIQLSNVDIGDLTLSTDSAQLIIGHHKLTGKKVKLQRPLAVIHKRRDMMDEGGDEYDVVTILKEKYVFSDRPGLIVQESLRGLTRIGK
ncbi:Ctf8-domain-containing protein [Helicostylum pulchrum]|nr:Ctf8-domain-containing protein [Helicostylum pulchrum]